MLNKGLIHHWFGMEAQEELTLSFILPLKSKPRVLQIFFSIASFFRFFRAFQALFII